MPWVTGGNISNSIATHISFSFCCAFGLYTSKVWEEIKASFFILNVELTSFLISLTRV